MATPDRLEIRPVTGLGEIVAGADLPALLAGAAPWLADGDVLVVTSKIISKAEGRLVPVPPEGPEREAAREAVLAAETARPVARRGPTRIVQTRHGFVLASAGIDASNVDGGHLVLLPVDPDASARRLRAGLRARSGLDVAVVVTDTMGRPWRLGLADVAIGAAGIPALRDHRGEKDAHGNPLHLTQMAVIDELAGAAELVKGKHDQVPVAVVRGLAGWVGGPDLPGAAALVRGAEADLFPLGTAEAHAEGLRRAAALGGPDSGDPGTAFSPGGVDAALLSEAISAAGIGPVAGGARAAGSRPGDGPAPAGAAGGGPIAAGGGLTLVAVPPPAGSGGARALLPCTAPGPLAAAAAGARVHGLRAACAAAGLATAWLAGDPPPAMVPAGLVPLGLLLVGWPARG